MTGSKLVIVLPFRFQFKVFKYASIQDLLDADALTTKLENLFY
jgi:hypothetical protein